jgi:hypothetical protein
MAEKSRARAKPRKRAAPLISDAAVKQATGRTWKQWFALLDEANACALKHAQIVKLLPDEIGGWWQQMVTVSYERARQLREVHQRSSGEFAAAATKTFNLPLEIVYAAWKDARSRAGWLAEGATVRKATPNQSIRLLVGKGAKARPVDVTFSAKGDGKAQVTVDHRELTSEAVVQAAKAGWKEAFERLQKKLATMG